MGECGLARSPLIHSVIHPRVSKFVLENTAFITEFLAWSPFKTYIRADRQTELASYVIEDDVHFIRATGTPSFCPSSPARPRRCPAHCPLGTNAAPPLGRPLFHESYTLYRHLPSPSPSPLARSLPLPSLLPPRPVGYVRCQIGTTTIAMFYWRRRPLSGRGSRTANGMPAQGIRLPRCPSFP